MRMLFEIDTKDYDITGTTVSRPSARGIIIRDGKLAMVYSHKYNYYKFPGGGIEPSESNTTALIREVMEETGLKVIDSSILEYGMVHRIQKGDYEDVFIQDNYYYLCDVEDKLYSRNLDDYEKEEGFTLKYVTPKEILKTNSNCSAPGADNIMLEREIRMINIMLKEGIL